MSEKSSKIIVEAVDDKVRVTIDTDVVTAIAMLGCAAKKVADMSNTTPQVILDILKTSITQIEEFK